MPGEQGLLKKFSEQIANHNKEIIRIEKERREYWKKIYQNHGFFSEELTELRSGAGNPFEEIEDCGQLDVKHIRKAQEQDITKEGKGLEHAYYCERGGGWVKGTPKLKDCGDSDSDHEGAGIQYVCIICGRIVGGIKEDTE